MMRRIRTVIYRYLCLHFRSAARLLELFFWPAMELILWGFLSLYLREQLPAGQGRIFTTLLAGLIFWDILYRSQQSVSLALMEELWTRNMLNLLISPLKSWEWVVGVYLYGFLKTGLIAGILLFLAVLLYSFDIFSLGFYFIPFMFNLLLMGWAVGLFTSGLLLRWGHAAEALIWGIPFLIQPFSAIFYPLTIYPRWLQPLCLLFPSTHVLEGMRQVIHRGTFSWSSFGLAIGMNLVYFFFCASFCSRMLERGRRSGQLIRVVD